MTLAEIIGLVIDEYGTRNQITEQQALAFANVIQQQAFNRDLDAFLVWDNYLTLNSVTPQGPYNYPSNPPCRRFLGVTSYTEDQILGFRYQNEIDNDYGIPVSFNNTNDIFIPIRNNIIDRTWKFVDASPSEEANYYRQIYYRRPPELRSSMDDDSLIIPDEFHMTTMVMGIAALAEFTVYGDKASQDVLTPYLQPFWDRMITISQDGNRSDTLSEGQPGL